MQIYKSCHNDFGYNDTVCDNLLKNFTDENDQVQEEVRKVHIISATRLLEYFSIFGHLQQLKLIYPKSIKKLPMLAQHFAKY